MLWFALYVRKTEIREEIDEVIIGARSCEGPQLGQLPQLTREPFQTMWHHAQQ